MYYKMLWGLGAVAGQKKLVLGTIRKTRKIVNRYIVKSKRQKAIMDDISEYVM